MTKGDIVGVACFAFAGGLAGARWGYPGAVGAVVLAVVMSVALFLLEDDD